MPVGFVFALHSRKLHRPLMRRHRLEALQQTRIVRQVRKQPIGMVILDEIAGEPLGLFMSQTINKHLSRAVSSIAALGLAGIFDELLDVLRVRLLACSCLLLQLLQHLLGS